MKPNLGGLDLKSTATALAGMVQVVGASSSFRPKGHRFDPWSGHMPKLGDPSPIGARTGGNPSIDVSPLSFSFFFPSSLWHKKKNI